MNLPATAAKTIKAARLDWTVTKVSRHITGGSRFQELHCTHAVVSADRVRTPAWRVLGIVGDRYDVLHDRPAFRFFDGIVGETGAIPSLTPPAPLARASGS